MIEAAAIPEVAATVYSNLAMIAGLTTGQTVLIHGAGGGIGTFAIQWATAIGAHVITTAGSDAKVQAGLDLGATTAINYHDQRLRRRHLMEATGGRGVDAILDVVGTDYFVRNLECLAAGRASGDHRRYDQPRPSRHRLPDVQARQRLRGQCFVPVPPIRRPTSSPE